MKNNSINPWLIFRWATVVLLFTGTIMISWDQIKTKDEEIRKAETALETSKQEFRKATTKEKNIAADLLAAQARIRVLEDEAQAQLLVRIQDLKAKAEVLRSAQAVLAANPATADAGYQALGASSSSSVLPSPVVPNWVPPAPSVLAKQIKDKATADWKDNYAMVNSEIERQNQGYNTVLGYYKTANPTVKAVLNKAAQEWPNNYAMMASEIERQLEAKQQLDRH